MKKASKPREPSRASLREVPEVDFTTAKVRRNQYAARVAAEGIVHVRPGRPRKGTETGPTEPRSIRFPAQVWALLEKRAKAQGLTLHSALRSAFAECRLGLGGADYQDAREATDGEHRRAAASLTRWTWPAERIGRARAGALPLRSQLADVPSMTGSGLGFVADHFDVVAVRTDDISRIVVRVVVRAQTRRAIVLSTRLQRRAMEGLDLLAILGRERQVKMRRLLLGLVQAQ
jgi:hypothetical protein